MYQPDMIGSLFEQSRNDGRILKIFLKDNLEPLVGLVSGRNSGTVAAHIEVPFENSRYFLVTTYSEEDIKSYGKDVRHRAKGETIQILRNNVRDVRDCFDM